MVSLHRLSTATFFDLDLEIRGVMKDMDKLRNRLYEEYKPQIKLLEEVNINDGPKETLYPYVATKKVTQASIAPSPLSQDNQVEILPIERDAKEMAIPKLPPAGPLVKTVPEIDGLIYVMKNPLMPWQKAKVRTLPTSVV